MSYEKKVSRKNPGLIVTVLDDSGSQGEKMAGTNDERYKWVERDMGHILKLLLSRSSEVKGDTVVIKPRYYIHTIVYGGSPQLWGTPGMDIQAVVEKFTREGNSLGLGGKLGGTDAMAALQQALDYLRQAVTQEQFRDSFPPMVFHITDGESWTDASSVAEQIKQLQTSDGNVLILNAYIGTQTSLSYKEPEDFPGYVNESEAGPRDDNIRMFQMSSEVPECIRQNLIEDGTFPNLRQGARLFFDVRTKDMLKNVIQVVGSLESRADRQVR